MNWKLYTFLFNNENNLFPLLKKFLKNEFNNTENFQRISKLLIEFNIKNIDYLINIRCVYHKYHLEKTIKFETDEISYCFKINYNKIKEYDETIDFYNFYIEFKILKEEYSIKNNIFFDIFQPEIISLYHPLKKINKIIFDENIKSTIILNETKINEIKCRKILFSSLKNVTKFECIIFEFDMHSSINQIKEIYPDILIINYFLRDSEIFNCLDKFEKFFSNYQYINLCNGFYDRNGNRLINDKFNFDAFFGIYLIKNANY